MIYEKSCVQISEVGTSLVTESIIFMGSGAGGTRSLQLNPRRHRRGGGSDATLQ